MSLGDRNRDADEASLFAFEMDDDPSPREIAKAAKRLLGHFHGDIARLTAAMETCQAEHRRLLRMSSPGATRIAVTWRTIELIDAALALARGNTR